MLINHLVISGGGPKGLVAYGALQQLNKSGVWDIKNIKSIWASSFGAIIGVVLCLGYSWDDLDDYIVKRPWQDSVKVSLREYLDVISTKGIITNEFCEIAFKPLLEAKDIPIDISLRDFQKWCGITLNFFGTNINTSPPASVLISEETIPNVKLLEALTISTAVPILIPPVFTNDMCLIDGGLINNFPVEACLSSPGVKKDNVLGVQMIFEVNDDKSIAIDPECDVFSFLSKMLGGLISSLALLTRPRGMLKYEVECIEDGSTGLAEWEHILNDHESRKSLITRGMTCAERISEKWQIGETE
jgi:NTE family protein